MSEDFEYYHADKLTHAREWLAIAKEKGTHHGLRYLGPA